MKPITITRSMPKKLALTITLACALMISTLAHVQPAHADFLSCATSGSNIADCLSQENKDKTSFTEFSGGLSAPSTEGYDKNLVQATTARDFVLNVTNFALGFLGLVSMIIIIYGGVLYVTAAGEEERATKGKKSVTYAVIGIVLILGSYAIVNTLLLSSSKTGEAGLAGSAPEGGSVTDQQAARRALFNLAGAEVNAVARDFATAYQNYAEVSIAIDELLRADDVTTREGVLASMQQKTQILERIKQKAGQFSSMNEAAQSELTKLQNLNKDLGAKVDPKIYSKEYWTGEGFNQVKNTINASGSGLKTANEKDFAMATVDANEKVQNLQNRISKNIDIGQADELRFAFEEVTNRFKLMATGSIEKKTVKLINKPNNAEILLILRNLANLSEAVKNIQFVYTVITADTKEGNAPLIVSFEGLKSLDPLNRTIPTNNYEWDFGGDKGLDIYGLNETSGPAVLHVFNEPGTYIVKLNIKALPAGDNEPQIIDGTAYTIITVHPPVTKINLNVNISGQEPGYPLRRYDEKTGNLIMDRGVLKVTPGEANAGLSFDASTTLDKERIQSVRWNFGDNSPEILGAGASLILTQTHSYAEQGTYQLILEVTDIQNNIDRVVLNVVVSTPIARMNVSPGTQLFVNEDFILDASTSISDGAQITDYTWIPANEKALKISGPKNIETLKGAFLEPGTNKIELKVSDSIGGEDTDIINIRVESKAPEAEFKYSAPNITAPAIYEFDGNLSFDPDGEGPLTYKWTVDGQTTGTNFEFVNGTSSTSVKPNIKFKDKGTFVVALTAIDPNGFGTGKAQEGKEFSKQIEVKNTLDIGWKATDKTAATLVTNEQTGESGAEINLNLESEHAVAFDLNWGDGETESGAINQIQALSHVYKNSGTYTVKATVFDESNLENTISRKVFIGSAETPVAIVGVSINGNEIFDTASTIKISRNDTVSFDAGKSLNTDGTGLRVKYSWDFGNGQKSTQQKANQQYKEIGTYNVSLKVVNSADVSQVSSPDTITIQVIGEPPVLRSITAIPTGNTLTTPVTVEINALNASDPDGRITRYRWWYYDPNNDTDQLGLQVTTSPTATLTIGTRGMEGEKKTYKFAVELTDDENNSISSRDLLDESRAATLEVTNGPNKAPIASFNVDRTIVFTGEPVNFTSGSSDPDGQIVAYYWDFEGDGFADNTENLGSNVSHIFNNAAQEGIKVRLKVKDNNESEASSDPITIYVDAVAKDPISGFTSEQQAETKQVQFTDTSQPDLEANVTIESWTWDFDVSQDSNGDGIKDNDTDSTEQNPLYEYPDYAIYRAKLTILDSKESKSSVINFVNAKAPVTKVAKRVEARLLTNPAPNLMDGKVHLQNDNQKVILEFSTSVGEITRYTIDKNIYFDTDGNGKPDDDIDYAATKPGKWSTEFQKDYGPIKVRLTVEDQPGNKDTVDKEIIFDSVTDPATSTNNSLSLTTNIFADQAPIIPGMLVSLAGFGILLKARKHIRKNKKNE